MPAKLFRSLEKDAITREGLLEVSYKSLHFTSWDAAYAVTMTFVDVQSISQKRLDLVRVKLVDERSKRIYLQLEQKGVAGMISQLHKVGAAVKSNGLLSSNPSDPAWREKQEFFRPYLGENSQEANYRGNEADVLNRWRQYLDFFGRGSTIIRTDRKSVV